MKYGLLLLLVFAFPALHAQVMKRLGERVKGNEEWKVQRKANQAVDDGLDSLLAVPKKVVNKNKEKKNKQSTEEIGSGSDAGTKSSAGSSSNSGSGSAAGSGSNTNSGPNNAPASAAAEGEQGTSDGYVKLSLSADQVFTGGSVRISGESVMYKNFKTVELRVSGPSPTDTRQVSLDNEGRFIVDWNASQKTGTYTVTLTSSDKKASKTAKFEVTEIDILFAEDWPEANTRETKRALANLEDAAEEVADKISTQNRAELQLKLKDTKDQVETALQLFQDLGKANREMAQLMKKNGQLPKNLKDNLSELNNTMAQQARELKQLNDAANHKPQDNTICEYLVMLNEACAAFSTFTNGYTKTISGLIKNIAIDKGVPKTVSVINENTANIPQPADFPMKEAAKLYATSKYDAESLTTKLGKAGMAGDIIQFATDVLMKIYCEVFSGSFKHDYKIDFRNGGGETWWKYGVEMQAALTLRAPKSGITKGDIIKLKGNLEGNATNFTFFTDVEKEDEFKAGTKGDIQVIPIKTYIPLKVSFATAERDILGFGAIARGLATPAYFNIPIDAEYDVDNKKIKIFINEALIDFSPLVQNQFLFVMVGGDLLPYVKYMTFPIHKARLTINGVMASNHEFEVSKNEKGKTSFSGKGSRHIGDAGTVRETVLNFTLDVSKQ